MIKKGGGGGWGGNKNGDDIKLKLLVHNVDNVALVQ